jgi:hypothetical protein
MVVYYFKGDVKYWVIPGDVQEIRLDFFGLDDIGGE